MKKHFVLISVTAVLIGMALAPAVAQAPLVNVSLGFSLDSDFAAGDGDWTTTDIPEPERPAATDFWEWGAPTSGPGGANSGSNAWATNLAGTYDRYDCGAIASPAFSIPAGASASVSFMHWKHMEASTWSGSGYDGGMLFVTTDGGNTFTRLVPDGGYDASLLTSARNCLDGQSVGTDGFTGPAGTTPPGPAYTEVTTDLSAFAGETVQFVMAFGADCCSHRDGWYIDDFTTTINGASTTEDFESDDGGFTIMTTAVPGDVPFGWSHEVPSKGPEHGVSMWGTNPSGGYGDDECAWIESPAFTVGPLDGAPSAAFKSELRWTQWLDTSTFSAGGLVQVGLPNGSYVTIEPDGGYWDTSYDSDMKECTGDAPAIMTGSHTGDELVEMTADMSEFTGMQVTVRFLFASDSGSSSFDGWYIGSASVETFLRADSPDVDGIIDGLGIPGVGGADAPLWTSGGEESSWAFGVVTDTSSNTDAYRGQTGYMTNLDGDTNNPECSWIQSPAVPGAAFAADPTLSFTHAYRIPGASVDVAWGGGLVLVSTDGGVTWEYLNLPEYDRPLDYSGGVPECFTSHGAPLDGNVFSGVQNDLETVEVDLSEYADAPTVQVRFVFGVKTFAYEGWFINDVQLGGVDVL